MTHRRGAAVVAIVLATAMAAAFASARQIDPLPDGLQAQYFANSDWTGVPARTSPAGQPSTADIVDDTDASSLAFSVSWNGWLIAPSTGIYTFGTESSDGSWVFVDGQAVVDNGGVHASRPKAGPTIVLERGPHQLHVKYFRTTRDATLTLLWRRGSGPFQPVPSWPMRPKRIGFVRFAADRAADICAAAAWWLWSAALVAALVFALRPEIDVVSGEIAAAIADAQAEGAWRVLVG